jgi:hypothetical protein
VVWTTAAMCSSNVRSAAVIASSWGDELVDVDLLAVVALDALAQLEELVGFVPHRPGHDQAEPAERRGGLGDRRQVDLELAEQLLLLRRVVAQGGEPGDGPVLARERVEELAAGLHAQRLERQVALVASTGAVQPPLEGHAGDGHRGGGHHGHGGDRHGANLAPLPRPAVDLRSSSPRLRRHGSRVRRLLWAVTHLEPTAATYEHPRGTVILVVGILGVALCQLAAPFAWVMGSRALAEIDSAPGVASNRGMVQAGRICGIVGSCILIVPVVSFVMVTALRSAS